ncbi:MAG: hypothetical protein NVSMB62_11490 [Acidobacteriaceae bacterium]
MWANSMLLEILQLNAEFQFGKILRGASCPVNTNREASERLSWDLGRSLWKEVYSVGQEDQGRSGQVIGRADGLG